MAVQKLGLLWREVQQPPINRIFIPTLSTVNMFTEPNDRRLCHGWHPQFAFEPHPRIMVLILSSSLQLTPYRTINTTQNHKVPIAQWLRLWGKVSKWKLSQVQSQVMSFKFFSLFSDFSRQFSMS